MNWACPWWIKRTHTCWSDWNREYVCTIITPIAYFQTVFSNYWICWILLRLIIACNIVTNLIIPAWEYFRNMEYSSYNTVQISLITLNCTLLNQNVQSAKPCTWISIDVGTPGRVKGRVWNLPHSNTLLIAGIQVHQEGRQPPKTYLKNRLLEPHGLTWPWPYKTQATKCGTAMHAMVDLPEGRHMITLMFVLLELA